MVFKIFVEEIDMNCVDRIVHEGDIATNGLYVRFLPNYPYPRCVDGLSDLIGTFYQNHWSIEYCYQ